MIVPLVRASAALALLAWLTPPCSTQEPGPLRDWIVDPVLQHRGLPFPEPTPLDIASWTTFADSPFSGLPLRRAEASPGDDAEPMPRDVFPIEYEPSPESDWLSACREGAKLGLTKICWDFKHNYTGRNLGLLALTVAIAAPLANTDADDDFSRWYQRDVRSRQTQAWAEPGNYLGQHLLTVPIFLGAAGIGTLWGDHEAGRCVGDWGKRSIRALIVGSPAVGVLQITLGAGRPGEYEDSTYWRPFNDVNGVAGHGFVGAVPFLTAASMTERRGLKALFIAGSFWTSWARVDRDAHSLSQSILGWSIACLAVQSVSQTEAEYRRWQLVPLDMPEGGSGIGILFRY